VQKQVLHTCVERVDGEAVHRVHTAIRAIVERLKYRIAQRTSAHRIRMRRQSARRMRGAP
jgi:hypothetical protein